MTPAKPRADFPLLAHATKRWAKKIRGKRHYFGAWDDPQGALAKYEAQKEDLHAGRTPRAQDDGLTIRDLVNGFLTLKKSLRDSGELPPRSFACLLRAVTKRDGLIIPRESNKMPS